MILAFMCSFECVIAYISTFHLSCLRLMFRCFSVLPSFMRLCILLGLARFEFVLFCGKFFIDYSPHYGGHVVSAQGVGYEIDLVKEV
jgi:hypothetical protein